MNERATGGPPTALKTKRGARQHRERLARVEQGPNWSHPVAELEDTYIYRVTWSDGEQAFLGQCAELPRLRATGSTAERALFSIRKRARAELSALRRRGEKLPIPLAETYFSGQLRIRMPPTLHRRLALEAAEDAMSLNHYIVSKLGGDGED